MYMKTDYDGETFEANERDRRELAERREEERDEMRADDLMLEIANGWAASVIRTQRKAA